MTTRFPLAIVLPDGLRVGIAVSKTNAAVTDRLCDGCVARLKEVAAGVEVTVAEVAGAYELVAASRWLLDSGCAGVIAIGAVIRGDTPHFEYICDAVTRGLATLSTDGHYVAFGILTTNNLTQAMERAGGALGNKGAEAADAMLQMLSLRARLSSERKA